MGALVRRGLLALACLVAAIAAPAAAARTPHVTTELSPQSILFGDPVSASVVVTAGDSDTVAIAAPTAPWTARARRTTTSRAAGTAVTRLTMTLTCLTTACLPTGSSSAFTLPPVTVTVHAEGGGTRAIKASWPRLVVSSRLAPGAASAASPPFRLQTAPPPLDARVSPKLAAWLLDAGALLLAAGAAALSVVAARRRRAAHTQTVSPLDRALVLVREAKSRPAPDRRRALSLLATVAPQPAADEVAAVAWAQSDPTPAQLDQLSHRVEDGR